MAGARPSRRVIVAGLTATALTWSALPGQQTPPGCSPAQGIGVAGVVLGEAAPPAREAGPAAPADRGRVRSLGRGVYIGVSADTVVSIGVEAPSRAALCGLRVGDTRAVVAARWGEPRSRLPSAWLYRDTAGVSPHWVAVVYFGSPSARLEGATDKVARVAIMIGPGAL